MKKTLFILCALLLAGIGAWADDTDVTSTYIQNPSFESCDISSITADDTHGYYKISSVEDWTLDSKLSGTYGTLAIMTAASTATDNGLGNPGNPSDGTQMLYVRDSWITDATTTTLTQVVTLPAGTYKLTVDTRNATSASCYGSLMAGDASTSLTMHTTTPTDDDEWDTASLVFTVAEGEGTVTIGVSLTWLASSGNNGIGIFLLDNFRLYETDEMELTAHEDDFSTNDVATEAFSHWYIDGNSSGSFQLNTWSTESDESGMKTPFIEYWIGSGSNLADATISHETLAGLPAGNYEVSIFVRAFNDNSTTAVGKGIVFFANDASEDLTDTDADGNEGSYSGSAEEYGTYTLNCTVGADGTLKIGFTITNETSCDWLAFKNLKVVMKTTEEPELTALSGEMDSNVQSAMNNAISAYNTVKTSDNFKAAIDAMQDAQASIAKYAATLKDGDYLIVNTETSNYLAGGLTWGTQSMEGGKPQFFTLEVMPDGRYTLDSHQSNGGNAHYLGSGLYCDAVVTRWTITQQSDGTYAIYGYGYNSTDANGVAVYTDGYLTGNGFQTALTVETADQGSTPSTTQTWTLVTKDDIIAEMDKATLNRPVDVSALIPSCEPKRNPWGDYNFQYNYNSDTDGQNWGSWTCTGYNIATVPNNYSLGQGANTASIAESYYSSNGFDIRQPVTFPKKGKYKLTAQGFYRDYASAMMYVGTSSSATSATYSVPLPVMTTNGALTSTASDQNMVNAYTDFLANLFPVSLEFEVAADETTLYVGFYSSATSNGGWNIFGELGLEYYGAEETISWDMTSAGWGTLILPFAVATEDVPSALTVYSCTSLEDDETTLSLTEETAGIASCTPYILSGAEDTYTFTGTPENGEDSYTAGLLTGTFVDMTYDDFTADGTEYVLQNQDAGLAFYPIVSGLSSEVTLTPYHCYLTDSSGKGVRGFISFPSSDEATGIVAVESEEAEGNGAIYDLSGRKVSKAVKGVYIQNGKKVLVK